MVANLAQEEGVREVVARHRERFGRLDVLINNAGVGIGAAAAEHQTKFIDLQLDVNLRVDHPVLPRVRGSACARRGRAP